MVIKTKPYRVAIVLGRFQVFHKAHYKLVAEALEKAGTVVIVLGSHQAALNIINPFTAKERAEMIRQAFPDADLHFIEVPDYYYNDTRWFYEVQAKAYQKIDELGITLEVKKQPWENQIVGPSRREDVCICGYYKDASSYYLDYFKTIWSFEGHRVSMDISSTYIRNALFSSGMVGDRHWTSKTPKPVAEWLIDNFVNTPKYHHLKEEYDYAASYRKKLKPDGYPYPNQPVAGDNVVFQNGMVLMVIRKAAPGKGLWALPGGFIHENERIEHGALRELKEETRIDLDKAVLKRCLKDKAVFDHTTRDVRGRIVSHTFFYKLDDSMPLPKVKGSDDALKAFWVPWNEVIQNSHRVYSDHIHIISYFLNRY